MKKPWLALFALLPVLVLGFSRLRLETDILATLPGEVPEVRALKLLRDGFSGGSDLIIALETEDEAASEELTSAIAEVLGKRTDLVKEVRWGQPMESQARSGADMARYVAYVAQRRPFGSAYLVRHEIAAEAPDRPYRFTVEAQWKD